MAQKFPDKLHTMSHGYTDLSGVFLHTREAGMNSGPLGRAFAFQSAAEQAAHHAKIQLGRMDDMDEVRTPGTPAEESRRQERRAMLERAVANKDRKTPFGRMFDAVNSTGFKISQALGLKPSDEEIKFRTIRAMSKIRHRPGMGG